MSQQTAPSPQEVTYNWLRFARDNFTSVQNGTGPTNNSGGQSAARLTFDVETPKNPFWAWAIGFQFNVTVDLTIPASGSVVLSPFAPHSLIGVQLTIGGGQAIQPMSLVPFHLDNLTQRRNWAGDKSGPGSLLNTPSSAVGDGVEQAMSYVSDWEWDGSDYTGGTNGIIQDLSIEDASSNKYIPGQTITNSGTASETLKITFKFKAWMQLGRKLYGRSLEDLTGCIPMGDPANRPNLYVNVQNLIGSQPESNPFVSATSGVTCTTDATTAPTCQTIWICKELDQLPSGVQVGTPSVIAALEVNTNAGASVQNAGQYIHLPFDTAMVYQKRFHVLVNNQKPISADYFALLYSENQANNRWAFDGTANNMQEYFRQIKRRYGRYLPKGVYVADLVGGDFPEFPRETPYRGEIVTSTTLAALTGLKAYPNAETDLRVPSGTSMTNGYCTTYSFGTVPVSY